MDNELIKHLPKAVRIKEEIKAEIIAMKFGEPGSLFISMRKLCTYCDISLVTAHRVIGSLKEEGYIELKKNRYYLSSHLDILQNKNTPKEKTNKVFGCLVNNLENSFFSNLATEVEITARKHGYKAIIASTNYDTSREKEILKFLSESNVSGIIACPSFGPDPHRVYSAFKIPFIFVTNTTGDMQANYVCTHNYSGGQIAATHLFLPHIAEYGYIGIKGLENDLRFDGYFNKLQSLGYNLLEKNCMKLNARDYSEALPEIIKHLKKIQKPAGIFCFHDLLAVQVIKACRKLKLSIPEDISLVGFDNLPVAAETTPSITSISYPIKTMVHLALNHLLETINNEHTRNLKVLLEPDIVLRESTVNKKLIE